MKRLALLVCALVVYASVGHVPLSGFAPIALVSSATKMSCGTTSNIDTSGASLLVVWLTGAGTPSVVDSKSNTWTAGTGVTGGSSAVAQMFYAANPTVGSGHNFTSGGGIIWCSMGVLALSGVALVSPSDQSSSNIQATATWQPGSITPSEDGEVVVVGAVNSGLTFVSISAPYTEVYHENSGANWGGSMGYHIQTTATATNPTVTMSGSTTQGGEIRSFKAAPAASVGSVPMLLSRLLGLDAGRVPATIASSRRIP